MNRREGQGVATNGPQWNSPGPTTRAPMLDMEGEALHWKRAAEQPSRDPNYVPTGPSFGQLMGTKSGGGMFGSKFGMAPTEPVSNPDDPKNLPLDRVSMQPSALTNGNALPAYKLPSWATDSGDDPEGLASKTTFFNVPEQMSPFLKLDQFGVLPGTNLSAADYRTIGAGGMIPAQIQSQLQIERMMAGGPLAGTSELDGQWLDQYWDRWNKANGTAPVTPAQPMKSPVQEPTQQAIPDFVTMLQGAQFQPPTDFDLSRLFQGWQYQ